MLDPAMLRQKDSQEWAQLFEYVHASKIIFNSPAVTSEIVSQGNLPTDSGQTQFFYKVKPYSESSFARVPYQALRKDARQYTFVIDRMVEQQRFDLILTTEETRSFYHNDFTGRYSRVAEIKVDMPQTREQWTLVVWKPLVK
jgi:hypothetical protein